MYKVQFFVFVYHLSAALGSKSRWFPMM